MAGNNSDARSAAAWALAAKQHGILSRSDLLELGFSRRAVQHRLTVGRLHRIHAGVYAVGWSELTTKRRWMAAILACGPAAVLSHRSAAELWGFGREQAGVVDISVRRRREVRRAGIRARCRPSLPLKDVTSRDAIAVTRPARTLVDLASEMSTAMLERAVNEVDKIGATDPESLRAALCDFAGEPGVRRLRGLLDRHTFRLSDSALERAFRPIAEAAALPAPVTQATVRGFRVDFIWLDLGLVVETDGLRYHRTPASQARDRLRDQTLTAAGLTILRFTHRQVTREPVRVRRVLEETAARLSR